MLCQVCQNDFMPKEGTKTNFCSVKCAVMLKKLIKQESEDILQVREVKIFRHVHRDEIHEIEGVLQVKCIEIE